MIDMGSIAALGASLKTAGEMTKAMIDLRDTATMQEKVIELQGVILSAQSSALSAQTDQFALLERVRELEEQVAKTKEWESQKQRYQLTEVAKGSFAYTLKPDAQGTEPHHWLCTTCYEHGRRSVMQCHGRDQPPYIQIWRCPECRNMFKAHYSIGPGKENPEKGD